MSIDPFANEFPWNSPYVFAANNPITMIDTNGLYPIKPSVVALSALISVLKADDVSSLEGLFKYYGGNVSAPAKNSSQNRYLYSKKWGWIDMRHFAAAAYYTDKWYLTRGMVLSEGEKNEKKQETSEPSSAWSYEDLVSNLIGAYFEEYLENHEGTFTEVLNQYLEELGFVNDPLSAAPNANEIPGSHPKDPNTLPVEQNDSYSPTNTTEPRNGSTDKKLKEIIKSYKLPQYNSKRKSKLTD